MRIYVQKGISGTGRVVDELAYNYYMKFYCYLLQVTTSINLIDLI